MKLNKGIIAVMVMSSVIMTACSGVSNNSSADIRVVEESTESIAEVTETEVETSIETNPEVETDPVTRVTEEEVAITSEIEASEWIQDIVLPFEPVNHMAYIGDMGDVKEQLFDKYPNANRVSVMSCDITADGVVDYVIDVSNTEQIEYRVIDGATLEEIPDMVYTFDYFPEGGTTSIHFCKVTTAQDVVLETPSKVITFINRPSCLSADEYDNIVCQAKDTLGNVYEFKALSGVNRSKFELVDGKYYEIDSDYSEQATPSKWYFNLDGNGRLCSRQDDADMLGNAYIDNNIGGLTEEQYNAAFDVK